MPRTRILASRKRKPTSLSDEKTAINKLATKARWAIKIVAGVLALFFTWLQFKDFPVVPILESAQPALVLKPTLAIYYFSWIFGASFEVSIQQSSYARDPSRGRMTWDAIGAITALLAIAVVLLWASDDEKKFAAALSGFVIMNIILWLIYLRRIKPMIRESKELFQKSYFELERLYIVESYLAGKWQRHRFLVMCLLVATADVIAFSASARSIVSSFLASLASGLQASVVSPLLPSLVFVTFLLIAEGWIWLMRGQTQFSLNLITDLKENYRLVPLNSKSP